MREREKRVRERGEREPWVSHSGSGCPSGLASARMRVKTLGALKVSTALGRGLMLMVGKVDTAEEDHEERVNQKKKKEQVMKVGDDFELT